MTKEQLRAQLARTRPTLSRRECNPRVRNRLQQLDLFQNAAAIGAYMPLPDEVDLTPLFHETKARWFIPAFDAALGSYRMARYAPPLRPRKFGILEPEKPIWAERDELDLILVPGLAFDRRGNRLGRGGGFYDRLLPLYSARRAAICLAAQVLSNIPTEPHDCRMDLVVCESEVYSSATNH